MKIFDGDIIKQCLLETFWQKLWGAWQVLIGRAGIIILKIDKNKFYTQAQNKEG